MLINILYTLLIIVILLFLYIKIKYRFWSSQPVFHIYNIRQWLFPSGIIQHSQPDKTKFYDHNVVTKSFKSLLTEKKALLCHLIQGHYLYNKTAKYTPKKSDILEYFNYNIPPAIISLYIDPISRNTLGCITGRQLSGHVNGNYINIHYVDFLCIKKQFRKKQIAPKLIYSHYLNSRNLGSSPIFMFKREGNVNFMVPITIYKTYAISDINWKYPNMNIPRNFSCHAINPQNSELLMDFFNEIKFNSSFFIIPQKEIIYNLIKHSLIIPFLILNGNKPIAAIFYRYPRTSYNGEQSIECIASYCKKGYEQIFKDSFVNTIVLLKKKYTFSIILIENISHNYLLLKKILSRSTPKWVCPMAYYFYNFAYRPFFSPNVFILA